MSNAIPNAIARAINDTNKKIQKNSENSSITEKAMYESLLQRIADLENAICDLSAEIKGE